MLNKLSHMRQFVSYAACHTNPCLQSIWIIPDTPSSKAGLEEHQLEKPLGNIKAIHITAMLSLMTHAVMLYEMGGTASAGKRPLAQPSRMIYIQANLNPPAEPPQFEMEQQPAPQLRTEPMIQPEETGNPRTAEKIKRKKTVKHQKTAKQSSAMTQPTAPLQQASITSIVEIQQSYILQALEKIEEQKTYPIQARRRRISGSVTISIQVNSTGVIEKLECLKGPASLCRAAINVAEKAQPLPVLPEGTNHLAFEYQMQYKLH